MSTSTSMPFRPLSTPLSTHGLSTHGLSTHGLSTHGLSIRREPARGVAQMCAIALIVLAFGSTLVASGAAHAHGPTIEISHSEMKPGLLNLFVGTTVHFSNTVAMPGGHVVVDEGGTLESPPLAKPGDGWHYTFDKPGTYEIFIQQHPKTKARIVVVEKP